MADDYDGGEERCQTEILDPIELLLSERIGIQPEVDFWPKNIIVAPETAQKIKNALSKNTPFDFDSKDAIYVNIDPDHWTFK